MGVRNPVEFSDGVTGILLDEWEQRYGGKLEFVVETEEIIRKTLEHIDKKARRSAAGLRPDPLRRLRRRRHG